MSNDPKLIKQLQKGDKGALGDFYQRYSPILYGLCIRYCGNRPDAEDVMQDAMIKVLTNLPAFEDRPSGSFEGWIKTITVNTALNFLRQKQKGNSRMADSGLIADHYADETEPDEDIKSELTAGDLLEMICELPDGYRTVFNLYVFEGKSHKQIAELLEVTENTSKTQLFKARAWLRSRIAETVNDISR